MAETTKDVAKVEAQTSALAIVGEEGAALLADVREAAGAEGKYDLIALGSKGRSALKDLLVGSVAKRVIEISKVPVLLIP